MHRLKWLTQSIYMYIKIQLHCINSRLLNSKMGIYAGISSCASKILVFPVWYVLFCSTVTKFLCQTKVDNVELSLYKQQKKKYHKCNPDSTNLWASSCVFFTFTPKLLITLLYTRLTMYCTCIREEMWFISLKNLQCKSKGTLQNRGWNLFILF